MRAEEVVPLYVLRLPWELAIGATRAPLADPDTYGREAVRSDKRGFIDDREPPILKRLSIDPAAWERAM